MVINQTVMARSTGGKPAHFLGGGGLTPGTADGSGTPAPGGQGGKAP